VSELKVESGKSCEMRRQAPTNAHISECIKVAAELCILQAKQGVLAEEVVEGSGVLVPLLIIRNCDVLLQIQPEFQGSFQITEGLVLCCSSQL